MLSSLIHLQFASDHSDCYLNSWIKICHYCVVDMNSLTPILTSSLTHLLLNSLRPLVMDF